MYDCTADVMEHKRQIKRWLILFAECLEDRAATHDNSKLQAPEKEGFDRRGPELKSRAFGSPEYQQALAEMGELLKHHYAANRHHPEHFENGVDGMTLLDVVEMICDWMASANAKGTPVDLDHAAKRFHLTPQLTAIIRNTLVWFEMSQRTAKQGTYG